MHTVSAVDASSDDLQSPFNHRWLDRGLHFFRPNPPPATNTPFFLRLPSFNLAPTRRGGHCRFFVNVGFLPFVLVALIFGYLLKLLLYIEYAILCPCMAQAFVQYLAWEVATGNILNAAVSNGDGCTGLPVVFVVVFVVVCGVWGSN